MVSMVACFKIAAELWGDQGFGEWALARRLLSCLLPLIVCGLDVAIPRYVAIAGRGRGGLGAAEIMSGALLFTAASVTVVVAAAVSTQREIGALFFGDARYASLVSPLCFLIPGYALHILAYAYLRGSSRIAEANLIHVLMHGVFPLVALATHPASPQQAFWRLGALVTTLGLLAAVYAFRRSGMNPIAAPAASRLLVGYGLHRMLAAFGLLLLATLPGTIAANRAGVAQAGFVVFGLSFIGLAGSAAAPLGVTLLPLASGLIAEGRLAELRALYRRLQWIILAGSLAAAALVWLLAARVTALFFGTANEEAAVVLRICAAGAGPYFYFCCMRNFIDAHTESGLNTRNVMIALLAFGFAAGFASLAGGIAAARIAVGAYVVALVVLALCTWRATDSLFSPRSVRLAP